MKNLLKIVADSKIPFLKGVLDEYAHMVYSPGDEVNAEMVEDADAIITRTRTKCNAALLQGSKVKFIASATIGFDHIDTAWCEANGVKWTNAPGCNSESVKQYVGAVLALLITEKNWSLKERSIAVVGVGNVGSKVSAMAKAFGMTVYEIDPPRARVEKDKTFYSLEEVVNKVDIVTFHTPLVQEGEDKTYYLCDEDLLSQMKSDAFVINSSRGEVVNGDHLKKVLRNKNIGGAVLDVWEKEPDIDQELLDLVWIATPHIAGYSQDGKAKGTQMSVQAISKFFTLGLDEWKASGLPQPDNAEWMIDCAGLSHDEVIAQVILHTYSLMRDDASLRQDKSTFEFLRGAYPIRREFQAYNISLLNGNEHIQKVLLSLGFKQVKMVDH